MYRLRHLSEEEVVAKDERKKPESDRQAVESRSIN